ncbi:hypothetical protein [Nocardioides sp. InS609-2]|uniref:hypothetical protein n=1 Tax=Nocardioides sp. InS609-2 TaxID=2760705 RepID=UPI0020BDC53F|nr:hypothetical protein [Nocardioides sp. InS609-2]
MLRIQQMEERRREIRSERRVVYADLLSELSEIEASVDYFHRIGRNLEQRIENRESAAKAATEAVGGFDDVRHFKALHDLAAKTELVCTKDLQEVLILSTSPDHSRVGGLIGA